MNNLPQDLADAVKKEADNLEIQPYGEMFNRTTFIKGASFLYSIQPTCRWVKASERLPEYEEGLRIYAKYRGAKIIILTQWQMWLFHTTNTSIKPSDWKDIEWMEELPPPPQETAANILRGDEPLPQGVLTTNAVEATESEEEWNWDCPYCGKEMNAVGHKCDALPDRETAGSQEGDDFELKEVNTFHPSDKQPLGNTGALDASHGWWPELIAVPIAKGGKNEQ